MTHIHICGHTLYCTTTKRLTHRRAVHPTRMLLSKAFRCTSIFSRFYSQTAVHCFSRQPKKTLIYDYSVKEPWITTVLSTLSKLMVCRKLWKQRQRRGERGREKQPTTQQDNQLRHLSSSLDSWFSTVPKLHLAFFVEMKWSVRLKRA